MADKPDTPLTRYRKANGLSLEAFALKLGKSKGHLHHIETTMRCTASLAMDIEKETNGAISASLLNPDIAMARAA